MKEEEIIEYNKLIAKFMGIEIVKRNGEDAVFMFEDAAFTEHFRCTKHNTYHSDWNLLMPVIAKINQICKEKGYPLSNRSREQEHLENQLDNPLHWKSWSYHSIHNLGTDITKEYERVVSFIQWDKSI